MGKIKCQNSPFQVTLYFIFVCNSVMYCNHPYFIAGHAEVNIPINQATSRILHFFSCKYLLANCLGTASLFYLQSYCHIVSNTKPKKVHLCYGRSLLLFSFIIKPSFRSSSFVVCCSQYESPIL